MPMRFAIGTTSSSSCNFLPTSSGAWLVKPVTFPPGRARLATNPRPTGSVAFIMTIGTVPVAFLAARIAGSIDATITSALPDTRSRALATSVLSSFMRVPVFVQRYSPTTLLPSWYPWAARPSLNAASSLGAVSADGPR